MNTTFVVMARGYWGKGPTLFAAAEACRKAGAPARKVILAKLYLTEPKNIEVSGLLEPIQLISPQSPVTGCRLGDLLREK